MSANLTRANIAPKSIPYEDLTCAECGYGAVDNEGLCVIDDEHIAVGWTTELPQRDGYYFWRTLVKEQVIQRFDDLFYADESRFGWPAEFIRRQHGEYFGPIQSRHFEELLQLRKAQHTGAALLINQPQNSERN